MITSDYLGALRRERAAFPERVDEIDAEIVVAEAASAAAGAAAMASTPDVDEQLAALLDETETTKGKR